MELSDFELLKNGDFNATNFLIEYLIMNKNFIEAAKKESKQIKERDKQDIQKLKEGIHIAIDKGMLKKLDFDPPLKSIIVGSRTPNEIASEILENCPVDRQYLLALSGLSGTGKGTVVSILNRKIKNSICWSNGDLFRLLTYMIVKFCKNNSLNFDENLLSNLSFSDFVDKIDLQIFNNGYDLIINDNGQKLKLSEMKNRELKKSEVSTRIPSVARYTQGEVIKFSTKLFHILMEKGHTILLEGREPTLANYDTNFRFELVLEDKLLIGKRRASQKILAELHKSNMVYSGIDSKINLIIENYN